MEWGEPTFVLVIIAMSFAAWVINTAIRARHGYPVENEWGGMVGKDGDIDVKRLAESLERENELLRGKLGRLEERMAVLERIATDAPARLSSQIDQLR